MLRIVQSGCLLFAFDNGEAVLFATVRVFVYKMTQKVADESGPNFHGRCFWPTRKRLDLARPSKEGQESRGGSDF